MYVFYSLLSSSTVTVVDLSKIINSYYGDPLGCCVLFAFVGTGVFLFVLLA